MEQSPKDEKGRDLTYWGGKQAPMKAEELKTAKDYIDWMSFTTADSEGYFIKEEHAYEAIRLSKIEALKNLIKVIEDNNDTMDYNRAIEDVVELLNSQITTLTNGK